MNFMKPALLLCVFGLSEFVSSKCSGDTPWPACSNGKESDRNLYIAVDPPTCAPHDVLWCCPRYKLTVNRGHKVSEAKTVGCVPVS
ncbi:hypothetical protein KEM48_000849 [Puccinia striiformis f. sp. tritici PST-130]|nr:hypothetical protein Pst134EB_002128 [Puccinia striiformis f. sp. tritici]KAI9601745.1 hypothetical protein KEM48_000849 [Puccinia striiformis f. sp. tritici PST-130]